MSADRLARVEALLRSALADLDAGEAYAHHARRPVAQALQELTDLRKEQQQPWNSNQQPSQ